jgi:hypothetical protein
MLNVAAKLAAARPKAARRSVSIASTSRATLAAPQRYSGTLKSCSRKDRGWLDGLTLARGVNGFQPFCDGGWGVSRLETAGQRQRYRAVEAWRARLRAGTSS